MTACGRFLLLRFELDEEQVTPARPWNRPQDGGGGGGGGVNQVTVSLGESEQLDGYAVATTTSAPNGRPTVETVEVRQLTDGGLTHIQVHRERKIVLVVFFFRVTSVRGVVAYSTAMQSSSRAVRPKLGPLCMYGVGCLAQSHRRYAYSPKVKTAHAQQYGSCVFLCFRTC